MALLACIAVGAERKESALDKDSKSIEPDMSEFPDEWTKGCGDDTECRSDIEEPSWKSIGYYHQYYYKWSSWCKNNPKCCRVEQGSCDLEFNPAYSTTEPYGKVRLQEFFDICSPSPYWSSPLFIWTKMKQLPFAESKFGYSINERGWNG